MYRSSGGFKNPEHLLYQARMQYVTGHVEPYDRPYRRFDDDDEKPPEVWTIQKPQHVQPRNPTLRRTGVQRPRSAPAGRRIAARSSNQGGVVPYRQHLQRGCSKEVPRNHDKQGRSGGGGHHFGERGAGGKNPARRANSFASVVVAAADRHREGRRPSHDSVASRDIPLGREPRGRTKIKMNFAAAFGMKVLPVDRRLEFMKNEANRKRDLAARVVAKEKKRRDKIKAKQPLPMWKLQNQAGCWFWVDQNTGEARAAPPPERNEAEDDRVHADHHDQTEVIKARETKERKALRRVNNYLNQSCYSDPESDECDDESNATTREDRATQMGTGARFYDPTEFEDFMQILDREADKRSRRPKSAPAGRASYTTNPPRW